MLSRCVALALALVAAASAAAAEPVPLKVGSSDRPDQAALDLAFYRGYFARQGLAVELIPSATGGDFVSGLGLNQIQATTGSLTAALFNAMNRGIDVRIVADYAHVGTARDEAAAIVGRTDLMESGALKTPADLKGRSLGAGPVRAQLTELVYAKLLARANLTLDDVRLQYIGFPDSLAGLSTKALDAAFLIQPLVAEADRRGIGRVLTPLSDIVPGMELSVLQYSADFAGNEDAATRFMVAYLEGVRDFYDAIWNGKDEDATIALLAQHLALKDPTLWKAMRRYVDLNGRINIASIKTMAAFYKSQGTVTGATPDIDKFIDTRFAEAAVKRIGER